MWQARLGILVIVAMGGFAGGWRVNGWRHDAATLEARKARDALVVQLNEAERNRLIARQEADALALQLEDQAHADPNPDGGLPLSRVERLLAR